MPPPTDFAAFILTHGRPDNVRTYATLRRHGYTGPVCLIVDDEDATLPEYRARYGDAVVVFAKAKVAAETQWADNLPGYGGVVLPARNACFGIARDLGVRYFIQLDDDYTAFFRMFDERDDYSKRHILDLDTVFAVMLRFYQDTPFASVAMMQGGDFLGGRWGRYTSAIRMYRKAMNSFLCSTDRPFAFVGRVNEDVNTYVWLGSQGTLFGSFNQLDLEQQRTQAASGGMTDIYREQGTYAKSFYPVLFCPASVGVSVMRSSRKRIHHRIDWNATVPKIVAERHKKAPPVPPESRSQGGAP